MKTLAMIFCGFIFICSTSKSHAQLISKIEEDKTKHFVAGVAISMLSYELMYRKTEKKGSALAFGFGMGVLAGFAKELYDATGRGNRDYIDFLWTTTGAAMPCISLVIHL